MSAIIEDFNALKTEQFDPSANGAGAERLQALGDELSGLADREQAIGSIFALFERLPEADFGTPGPLVHLLEDMGGYEEGLARSLSHRPTSHTAWMASRLLNGELPEKRRGFWLEQLWQAAAWPGLDETTKEAIEEALSTR